MMIHGKEISTIYRTREQRTVSQRAADTNRKDDETSTMHDRKDGKNLGEENRKKRG
jgi:hypothetical protein